jgi:hypothetical protein
MVWDGCGDVDVLEGMEVIVLVVVTVVIAITDVRVDILAWRAVVKEGKEEGIVNQRIHGRRRSRKVPILE